MTNKKISELPAATTVAGGDTLVVVQGGVTKQATPDLLPLGATQAASIAATTMPKDGPRPWFLDSYNNYFTDGWSYVAGQSVTATTLAAPATAGATTINVTDGSGYPNGTVLLLGTGSSLYRVTAGGTTNSLTITPALPSALAAGATVAPFWANTAHPTTDHGYPAFLTWLMGQKRPDGTPVIGNPGTRPLVFFGNSWMTPGLQSIYTTAVQAVYPSVTPVMAGVSGNTISQMLARFDTDVPSNAAYVVINEPGVNSTGTDRATNFRDLAAVIRKIRLLGAVPVVIGNVPYVTLLQPSKTLAADLGTEFADPDRYPAVSAGAIDQRFQQQTLSGSTAYGRNALTNETAGHNTAIGDSALAAATTGDYNIAFGNAALLSLTTGSYNVGIGQGAFGFVTTASDNTGVGFQAGVQVTSGQQNTAVGSAALSTATSGQQNTAIGFHALAAATGSSNVAIGAGAGQAVTSGQNNIVAGLYAAAAPNFAAGNASTTASGQIVIGSFAGQGTATQADEILAIGMQALASGARSIAIGARTSAGGIGSVAIGVDASNVSAATTGDNQFALGTAAHRVLVAGRFNVAPRTPTASGDSQGAVNDLAADDNYLYYRTSAGWKRAALAAF